MSDVKLIELDGELVSRTEYCRRLGYNYNSITARMYRHNITFEQAVEMYLSKPIREYKPRGGRQVKDFRLYDKWWSMKDRCYNPKNHAYDRYGGRGIKVCDRWHDYFNFEDDMYESFIKHVEQFGIKETTLERSNYDGDYEPTNVTWATQKEQQNNRSSNIIVYDGLTFAEVCKKYNLSYQTAYARYNRGWTIEDIINTPIEKSKKHYLPCGWLLKYYCDLFNYSYRAIYAYINRYNLSPQEALARYLKNKQKKKN